MKPTARVSVFIGNVGDVIVPFIYSLNHHDCNLITNHDTLDRSSPGPTVNMLNLQMQCRTFDFYGLNEYSLTFLPN